MFLTLEAGVTVTVWTLHLQCSIVTVEEEPKGTLQSKDKTTAQLQPSSKKTVVSEEHNI